MRNIQFIKNHFYHIYNRGVEKRNIFLDDNNRWRFLQGLFLFNDENSSANLLWRLEKSRGAANFKVLREFLKENKDKVRLPLVRIMADCFMPNHYHLILEELAEGGITRFMHKLGTGYTQYFNKKYKRVGSLFQGPFKAILIDDELYLQYLLIYLNVINPGELVEPSLKEEGIKDIDTVMKFAEEYLWSTHKEYLQKRESMIIDKGILGELFSEPKNYLEFVRSVLSEKKFEMIGRLTLE